MGSTGSPPSTGAEGSTVTAAFGASAGRAVGVFSTGAGALDRAVAGGLDGCGAGVAVAVCFGVCFGACVGACVWACAGACVGARGGACVAGGVAGSVGDRAGGGGTCVRAPA